MTSRHDDLLTPLRHLTANPMLIARVADLEALYRRIVRSGEPPSPALLRCEPFFAGIDSLPVAEKERRLRAALAVLEGGEADGEPAGPTPSLDITAVGEFLDRAAATLPGIGPKTAALLAAKGIVSVRDVLHKLPAHYIDKRTIVPIAALHDGAAGYIKATVRDVRPWTARGVLARHGSGLACTVADGTGAIGLKWFTRPAPALQKLLEPGKELLFFGRVDSFRGMKEMHHPEIEEPGAVDDGGPRIMPVYHDLPQGVHQKWYRKAVLAAVAEARHLLPALLPQNLPALSGATGWGDALGNVHFPGADFDARRWEDARSRYHLSLILQELFLFSACFAGRKSDIDRQQARPIVAGGHLARQVLDGLRFSLTSAQQRALAELTADMARPHPMHRLLQGDVGSGKTIVALLAALHAVEAGMQVAIMAPTEILAEQHWRGFTDLLSPLGIDVAIVTSSQRRKERDELQEGLASGRIMIAAGTQALIQERVAFANLGLVVIDEQHRFGVGQRGILMGKGERPHVLLMTATPIPRTLALTVYGDLNISVIDELPPTRKPVVTTVLPDGQRERAFEAIDRELAAGRRAYVVYPVIDEGNALELKAATQMHELIAQRFPGHAAGLLHGRMKSDERDAVMGAFKRGEVQILVATTVIEVGVDVPEATVMVIEHGERFGLSQLHQLRGRIGRGADASRCIVLVDTKKLSEKGRARLVAFRDTADGFKLSETDLALRGPGELMGARQSGLPEFSVADIMRDTALVEKTASMAQDYFATPDSATYRSLLPKLVHLYFGDRAAFGAIG